MRRGEEEASGRCQERKAVRAGGGNGMKQDEEEATCPEEIPVWQQESKG